MGGADAVDVMAGLPWELKCPKVQMLCKKITILLCICDTIWEKGPF